MSQKEIKNAVVSGAVLATSLAVRDSIYALTKKLFPLPEDELYANVITALVTIILLFIVLWISSMYKTPEEEAEELKKKQKQKLNNHIAKLINKQTELEKEVKTLKPQII